MSTIFLQSAIAETYELNLLLEMLVTVPRLERLPSLKDMARDAALDSMPFGLLGYPVLQAVDILLPRAKLVPVGKDNQAHVEITREIARRFNPLYGPVFPEPEALIGEVPTLVGTDGSAKMSKSAGNAIFLSDDAETVASKVRGMYTDPKRLRATDPGTVEGNPVFVFHDAFNDNTAEVAELKERYRAGQVGDVEVKAAAGGGHQPLPGAHPRAAGALPGAPAAAARRAGPGYPPHAGRGPRDHAPGARSVGPQLFSRAVCRHGRPIWTE